MKKELIRVLQIGMHDEIGGVETYLMNYYRNIDRKRIQFDFINPYESLCFEDEIKKLGGKVYKIPNFKKNPIGFYNELKKIIKENNYKIVHINMLSAANILPVIAAKKCKVKHIILHSHNNDTPNGVLRKIMHLINKRILNKDGTDFFACSELAGNWLYDNKKDFIVINNAIDISKFRPNKKIRNIKRKELGVEEKFVIGHVGRFSYQKNHEFLIDVFYELQKENDNIVLLLIGTGELVDNIKSKVNSLKISDKVIFLGTTNKVNDYFNAMDLFVLPSRFEGLGIVAIEAQATNVKTILADTVPNVAKVVESTEFLSITNSKKWVQNINEIINNKSKKDSNFKIPKEYDIKYASKELERIYEKMY